MYLSSSTCFTWAKNHSHFESQFCQTPHKAHLIQVLLPLPVLLDAVCISFLSHRSIAIRVDGYLSKPHSINSCVPQGSVISPVLFILFINDLLSSTSSSNFSFADDSVLSSSFSSSPQHLAFSNISPYHNTSASLLTNDLTNVENWGNNNKVKFNQEKTKQVVISRNHHQDSPPPVFMDGHKLDFSSSFTQLALFHLISLGNPISIPLQSMHLRNLAFFLEPVAISHFLNY